MDIEMYNYVHSVFHDFKSGKFKLDRQRNHNPLRQNQMFERVLKEKIDYIFMPLPH